MAKGFGRLGLVVAFSAACSPSMGKRPNAGIAPRAAATRPVGSAGDRENDSVPSSPLPAPPAPSPGRAASHFPPPDVPPPSTRSAAEGDGRFTPFGDPSLGERAASAPPLVVRTVLHPHPESRWVTVTIAAVDLARTAVKLVAGMEDLTWAKLPVGPEAGLVPSSDRAALVLVANGGFQPKHGRWGLVASGVVVSRPREEGCTILLDDRGGVRIGSFTSLRAAAPSAASLRQTPPCLVEAGVVHPSLLAGRDGPWAGHAADLTTRRRSAVGVDTSGQVLFYALGEEAAPRFLAEALRLAGAAAAAELDINWYWTRFLLFGDAGGTLRVTSSLVPKMEHQETEYVERPSTRDFLYVVERPPEPP